MLLQHLYSRLRQRRLCRLLKKAAAALAPLSGSAWSDFDSGADMAAFIGKCIQRINDGTIDRFDKSKLWCMFAPTCDWDDMGGRVDLGNRVFGLLDALYGREIRSQATP